MRADRLSTAIKNVIIESEKIFRRKKMKVLQVVSSLNKNSGIANVVMNLYRSIDPNECQFDFLVFDLPKQSYQAEAEAMGASVYYCKKPGLKTFFKFKRQLAKFFSEHGAEWDVVHCHELVLARGIGKLARKSGCKYILHAHSTKFSENKIKAVRNKIFFMGGGRVDKYLACSRAAGQGMFGKKIKKADKFSVLYNGFDLNRYAFSEGKRGEVRAEFGIEPSAFVAGCVGRLTANKNCSFSLDAFKIYHEKNPDSYLMFVGEGEDKQALIDKAERLGIGERVIFAGLRSDVGAYLSAMDCFLFPSLFEGLGLAAVEAQANGLNCIVSDNIPIEACVVGCIRLPVCSAKDWADQMAPSKPLRERQAPELKIYDINHTSKQLTEIYRNLLLNR